MVVLFGKRVPGPCVYRRWHDCAWGQHGGSGLEQVVVIDFETIGASPYPGERAAGVTGVRVHGGRIIAGLTAVNSATVGVASPAPRETRSISTSAPTISLGPVACAWHFRDIASHAPTADSHDCTGLTPWGVNHRFSHLSSSHFWDFRGALGDPRMITWVRDWGVVPRWHRWS